MVQLRRTAALSLFAPSAPPTPKIQSEDELDGYAEETGPKARGLMALQLDGKRVSVDGSLPSSPDPRELGSVELERDTRDLLVNFYRTRAGMCARASHPAMTTLRRVVNDILDKHHMTYRGKPVSLNTCHTVHSYLLLLNITALLSELTR